MSNDAKQKQDQPQLNWGTGLAIVIALFVTTTLAVVIYLTSLDYHMVSENHYEKAVRYQQHIDRVEHTASLQGEIEIKSRPGSRDITIRFPSRLLPTQPEGTVTLYRPSDSNLDRTFELSLDDQGYQHIPAGDLARGKWLVKLSWQIGETGYFKETVIFI